MTTGVEDLIRLRDSTNPEDREAYNKMVANKPALRIAVGYETNSRATTENTD